MGVWERSPVGIAISMRNEGLLEDFRRALPDFSAEDNVGSPYCVRRYVVDEHLGRPSGLAAARKQLTDRGMRLILDFVPNYVAPDHPWVMEHPDYFIQGSTDELIQKPGESFQAGDTVLALGRDPYFSPWPEVAQLNGFHPGLRKAIIETVRSIAEQCDGMRCDMAMLLMTPIFERTWGHRAGPRPENEYWPEVIQGVRKRFSDVFFMAEAYWGKEWELQQQGFDYCYDKRLYDRLEHDQAESVRLHLCADLPYQEKLVRFIENHDEPCVAATFPLPKQQAAAVTVATLPGATLFHQGQFEGYGVKLPVFLEQVILNDIANSARFVIKRAPALDTEVFRHRDLHTLHVGTVPKRFGERIRKAEIQHVVDGSLPEIMVDAENPCLREPWLQNAIELPRRSEVGSERFLQHDTRALHAT
jgi:hypothetical protein